MIVILESTTSVCVGVFMSLSSPPLIPVNQYDADLYYLPPQDLE